MSPILLINEIQILIYVTVHDSIPKKLDEKIPLHSLSKTHSEQLGEEELLKSYQGLSNRKFKWLLFLCY